MAWGDLITRLKELGGFSSRRIATTQDRKAVRVPHVVTLAGLRPNGETLSLRAVDCAATGLRVLCPRALPKGEVLSLAVPGSKVRAGEVETEAPRARVAWSRKRRGDPSHDVGLAFLLDRPEQRKRVARFLLSECNAPLLHPQEKRRTARASTGARALLRQFGAEDVPVVVRNISVGGMNVQTESRFAPGVRLEVTIFLEGASRPLECRGEVLRTRQVVPGTFEIGLSFAPLDDDQRDSLVRFLTRALPQA